MSTIGKRVISALLAAPLILFATAFGERFRGSADRCEGNILIVSIFVNNPEYSWDFEDETDAGRKSDVLYYLGVACDYINKAALIYGKSVDFVWDYAFYDDLFYVYDAESLYDAPEWDEALWRYIDENVPSEALKEKYEADGVVYMTFMNTDENNRAITSTRNRYEGMPCPYEFVSVYYIDSGFVNCPAVYAHEILHTFGAPDLYMRDDEYGVSDDFVYWISRNYPGEIMYTCSDIQSGEYLYDRITNEISEITAYYIGRIGKSEAVEKMGLKPGMFQQD